ncbi:MAG: hypothetical protein HRT70_01350 [Flavobacteriaceae bacterium]|nr:hypothetical protein [Flavobacteriaceae bacterium]
MAIGRPTSYREEYAEMLIQHMSQGMTYTSFAGHPEVRVNVDTLYNWEKLHPAFSEAKSIGKAASEYFLLEAGHSSLFDKQNFNTTMWYMMMKNMHGWRDKQETTVEAGKTLTLNYSLDDNDDS